MFMELTSLMVWETFLERRVTCCPAWTGDNPPTEDLRTAEDIFDFFFNRGSFLTKILWNFVQ